jgi:hypothetical protein
MDKFPEAFKRFEQMVDVERIESFRQLRLAFASWAGQKWHDTPLQLNALAVEARKQGIPVAVQGRHSAHRRGFAHFPSRRAVSWRHEVVTVKGHYQNRYRDQKTGRFIKKP